jgi:hypothetical protein
MNRCQVDIWGFMDYFLVEMMQAFLIIWIEEDFRHE